MFRNRCQKSSYRTYVTFREKVVCRKCCGKLIKLINKTVVVKRSLLYLFTLLIQYGYQSVIIGENHFNWPPWKSM